MGVSGSVIGLKLEKNIEFEKNRQNSDLTIYVFTGHGCIRIGYWNQLDKKKNVKMMKSKIVSRNTILNFDKI